MAMLRAAVFFRYSRKNRRGGHILPSPPVRVLTCTTLQNLPLPNSRTIRRSEAGEAELESPEREDCNAYLKSDYCGWLATETGQSTVERPNSPLRLLNPRPAGGEFSAPLSNIRYYLINTQDIVT